MISENMTIGSQTNAMLSNERSSSSTSNGIHRLSATLAERCRAD
jgi:hypothetical protein